VSLARALSGDIPLQTGHGNRWLVDENMDLLTDRGTQVASLNYPHLSHTEISSRRRLHKRFYFRAPKIASIVGEMIMSPDMMKRRLREGLEFFRSCASAGSPRTETARRHRRRFRARA